ncbi:endonuclease/exonuclease/phosphatase family protein [Methanococcoides orientis]|uniref:exonuclease/endonuclease/phosphatase family protein n=1 Tax=Methanococcoides orientis TaxID=2822137 RepID=UPI001E5C8C4F|nr:endonuclease/exonuclease/phosphatase family protein [Methanococcoides orientis]UGV41691.1 endonuclease/exonuclease/phosphatase family protein [Methanococcoides orientis]
MLQKTILILFLAIFLVSSGCTDSTEDLAGSVDEIATAAAEVSGAIEEIESELNDLDKVNEPVVSIPSDIDDMDNVGDTTATPEFEGSASDAKDLRIGAFNIQVFGVTKASKPDVMLVLADIVRTYDIIAIQEIRDSSQTALPELVDLVNSDGSQYNYVVSERLGRTSSKEQYAYIYDSTTVAVTGTPETYPEPEGTDPFHRQPYISSFDAVEGDYDVVLMVIHTDPDEATEEINALDDVLEYAQRSYPDEGDFVIMGDFNADGNYFDEDSSSDIDGYFWLIDNSLDTTTKSTDYTYDRIVLTDASDLSGENGVFRYDLEYGLSEEMTVAVSDHYPVYMEVSSYGDSDL